jgi:toxin HigB-1
MKLIGTTVRFSRNFSKLCKIREKKFKIITEEKIALLRTNPQHPSLRLHKINLQGDQAWSISIDMKIRVLFIYESDGIILVDIGTHDEVY